MRHLVACFANVVHTGNHHTTSAPNIDELGTFLSKCWNVGAHDAAFLLASCPLSYLAGVDSNEKFSKLIENEGKMMNDPTLIGKVSYKDNSLV